jgi:putative ABC transport system permease protein
MPSMFVAVRTAGGADAALLPDVRAAVRSVDPELPIGGVMTMDERVGTSLGTARFRAAMIGASALLAAFLASLGVYAVRSQAVAARIREVGIRVALGATRAQILAMILIQGLRLVLTGVTLGLVAAAMLERAVAPWLYATRITDPALMAGTAAMLAAAAIVASWAPARRASAADPLTLLHHE